MLTDEICISKLIRELKLTGKQVYSNCFFRFSNAGQEWELYNSAGSLLLVKQESSVLRLFFFTLDFSDLKQLMEDSLASDREYMLEIVAKDKVLYRNELLDMGFDVFAQMLRMSVKDISPLFQNGSAFVEAYDEQLVEQARPEDVPALLDKLWHIFDTRVSHLPDEEELKSAILRGEFCLCREKDSDIRAFLQSVMEPRSFYINQVYNGGEKKLIHSIMHKRLAEYYQQGGRYVFAWVDEKNQASLRFHEKYGLKPDGLWTAVYRRKKQEADESDKECGNEEVS